MCLRNEPHTARNRVTYVGLEMGVCGGRGEVHCRVLRRAPGMRWRLVLKARLCKPAFCCTFFLR